MLNRLGKYGEAESLNRQVLALRQQVLGPAHPEVAASLNNLAFVLENQGKFEEAEASLRKAVAINQETSGPQSPATLTSTHNLAVVLSRRGQHAEADALFRQTLAIWRMLHGDQHPNVAASLTYLGRSLLMQGRPAAALEPIREAYRFREAQLRVTVSETRMQAMIQLLRNDEEMGYGLALSAEPQPAGRLFAMTLALLRKGRAVEAGALANRMLHRQFSETAVQQRFDEWQTVRQQHEALLYGGQGRRRPAEHQLRLKELQLQSDALEAELAQALPLLRTLQLPAFDDIVSAVARQIPKDGILIETVWMRPLAAMAGSRGAAPRLIALVLTNDRRVAAVDLGEAAVLDDLSHALLAALRNPNSDPRPAAQGMYRALLLPLLPHLKDKRELYLSLDGSLNLLPLDALHDGNEYLLGRYRFHYLTSGRDLLRGPSKRVAQAPVILANPDFGPAVPESSTARPASLHQQLAGLSGLPGTQQEANVLESLLGIRALTRDAATEEAVHGVHGPLILHIATHGLFLNEEDLGMIGRERPPGEAAVAQRSALMLANSPAPRADSWSAGSGSMSRSALVLAGVLQVRAVGGTNRDGLLTAEEARSLDLEGTQLVTLSACETGLGALSAGQGIYGLRRALLVAGAETLVTSLWRVHDEATGELMALYYGRLLDKNKPGNRLGAMVEAMQELRRRPDRSHPYYWAPFLVIGQDGPLRRPSQQASAQPR